MTTTLVTAERLSGVSVSKDGTWIAYYITFDADKSRNGIWVQRTDGSQRAQARRVGRVPVARRIAPAGDPNARVEPTKPFEVWEVDAATGKIRKLTDAAATPLQILNGDWRVSPDGRHIVYVNSVDRNLWLLTLPEQ